MGGVTPSVNAGPTYSCHSVMPLGSNCSSSTEDKQDAFVSFLVLCLILPVPAKAIASHSLLYMPTCLHACPPVCLPACLSGCSCVDPV